VVAFNLGKTVAVTFTYKRGLLPPVTSPPFSLNVRTIPAAEFVAPVITQASGTVLDLKTVLDGGILRFGGWPHIAAGQRIWLDLQGANAKGDPHNLAIWSGVRNAVTRQWASTGTFNQNVLFNYLKDLGDGSTLFIHFKVNMDGVANLETAVVFAPREYTILAGS
jgi:hypothetical protein